MEISGKSRYFNQTKVPCVYCLLCGSARERLVVGLGRYEALGTLGLCNRFTSIHEKNVALGENVMISPCDRGG